jgi:hypothetical protein
MAFRPAEELIMDRQMPNQRTASQRLLAIIAVGLLAATSCERRTPFTVRSVCG